MKKLILFLLLIPSLLFAQDLCWQEARMSLGVVGSGTPSGGAACTVDNDSEIIDKSSTSSTSSSPDTYVATKFVLSLNTTITQYANVRLCDAGSDVGNMRSSIWTHNAGTNKPDAEISDTAVSTNMSDIATNCTTYTNTNITLATPYALSAGTYWFVNKEENSAVRLYTYMSSSGDRECVSADGATWACGDNYTDNFDIMGCQ